MTILLQSGGYDGHTVDADETLQAEPTSDSDEPITLTTRLEAFAELADLNRPEPLESAASEDELDAVPPVVAIMVTHNADAWIDEALEALGAQTYPNLSILIIDADSAIDPTPRIASILPGAFVRRLEHNAGFGPTLNEVLELVSGASFFCLCHDDVALDPDCIARLVEEAFRSNAGIVGPKLVDWDDPELLMQVGFTIDKSGGRAPYAERGELDQGQHDAVRDVFAISGACMLVRSDLFTHLGGFDPTIDLLGEDLDLCWRAHLVGGRVVVAPAARARHREALRERVNPDRLLEVEATHRLRTVISNYRLGHLALLVPQIIVITFVEALVELSIGRRAQSRALVGAWGSNIRSARATFRARRRVHALREENDKTIRHLQTRTWARIAGILQAHRRDQRDSTQSTRAKASRSFVPLGLVALLVIAVVGTRELFFGSLPGIGSFARAPQSVAEVWRTFFATWNPMGLGSTNPSANALGPLAVGGTLVGGAFGFVRRIAIFAPIVFGLWGMWRLTRPMRSRRGQLVALTVYMANPVPWNALAQGHWSGLLVYGYAPWLLGACARAMRAEGIVPDVPLAQRRARWWVQGLGLGLAVGVVAVFVPAVLFVVVAVVAGLSLGSLAHPKGIGRLVLVVAAALAIAFVLGLPWSMTGPSRSWDALAGFGAASHGWLSVGDLLRFATGPIGAGYLGYGLLVVAALPLLIGRSWRFTWAVRSWCIALCCWAMVWLGQQDWFGLVMPQPEVLLAAAAAGLAVASACGMTAIERDLRGYRFGWPQAVSVLAGGALFIGVLPWVGNATEGRWKMSPVGLDQALEFVTQQRATTPFRVAWAGDPSVLPVAGQALDDRLSIGVSRNGMADMTELWSTGNAQHPLTRAVTLAMNGETTRLGSMLATMGIRYVIVPRQNVPLPYRSTSHQPDELLVRGLDDQLDLQRIAVNDAVLVYRNDSWQPGCALWQTSPVPSNSVADVLGRDAPIALPGNDKNGCKNAVHVQKSGVVGIHRQADARWHATINGKAAKPVTLWGWEQGFVVPKSGRLTITYESGPTRIIVLGGIAISWLLIVGVWLVGRRPNGRDEILDPPPDRREAPEPVVIGKAGDDEH